MPHAERPAGAANDRRRRGAVAGPGVYSVAGWVVQGQHALRVYGPFEASEPYSQSPRSMPAVASQILGHEPAFLGGRMQPSPPVCCLALSIHPRGLTDDG
jgi:hypothetical protein